MKSFVLYLIFSKLNHSKISVQEIFIKKINCFRRYICLSTIILLETRFSRNCRFRYDTHNFSTPTGSIYIKISQSLVYRLIFSINYTHPEFQFLLFYKIMSKIKISKKCIFFKRYSRL